MAPVAAPTCVLVASVYGGALTPDAAAKAIKAASTVPPQRFCLEGVKVEPTGLKAADMRHHRSGITPLPGTSAIPCLKTWGRKMFQRKRTAGLRNVIPVGCTVAVAGLAACVCNGTGLKRVGEVS